MPKTIGIKIVPRSKEKWVNNINQDWPSWQLWLTKYDKKRSEFIDFELKEKHFEWREEALHKNLIAGAPARTGETIKIYRYSKLFKKRIFVTSYICNECGIIEFPNPEDGIIANDCYCGSYYWTKFWIDDYAIRKLAKLV